MARATTWEAAAGPLSPSQTIQLSSSLAAGGPRGIAVKTAVAWRDVRTKEMEAVEAAATTVIIAVVAAQEVPVVVSYRVAGPPALEERSLTVAKVAPRLGLDNAWIPGGADLAAVATAATAAAAAAATREETQAVQRMCPDTVGLATIPEGITRVPAAQKPTTVLCISRNCSPNLRVVSRFEYGSRARLLLYVVQ